MDFKIIVGLFMKFWLKLIEFKAYYYVILDYR